MSRVQWRRELTAAVSRWRRPVIGVLLALLVVGTLGIGGRLALCGAGQAVRPDPWPRPRQARVAANGLVEGASREASLFPEVAGTLAIIHVRARDEVSLGIILFELHNDAQKAQVAVAEAELTSAQAQQQQGQADHQRARSMIAGRAISPQDFDGVHYRHLTAQAKVAEAQARLKLAKAELAKTQVRAPLGGRVLQIHYELGTFIEPSKNAEPVLRLADVSRRRVRAWVEELDAARVTVGQRAVVAADGFPGREFTGKVVELAGRMGQGAPRSNRPGEREDTCYREALLELDGGLELPLNLRVEVYLEDPPVAAWPLLPHDAKTAAHAHP